jgi:hypothetical protein
VHGKLRANDEAFARALQRQFDSESQRESTKMNRNGTPSAPPQSYHSTDFAWTSNKQQKGMDGGRVFGDDGGVFIDLDGDEDFAMELQRKFQNETSQDKLSLEQRKLKLDKQLVAHALSGSTPKSSVDVLRAFSNYDSDIAMGVLAALRDKWNDMTVDRNSEKQKSLVVGHLCRVRELLGRKADLKMRPSSGALDCEQP